MAKKRNPAARAADIAEGIFSVEFKTSGLRELRPNVDPGRGSKCAELKSGFYWAKVFDWRNWEPAYFDAERSR